MSKLIITGQQKLNGEITVAGNKNAAMPCLPAALLTTEPVTFTNIPDIIDVATMLEIIQQLGAKVDRPTPDTVTITAKNINTYELPDDLVAKLRSSILFMGPLLGRIGEFKMRHPGGCIIGRRPVGTHFNAVADLGGHVITEDEHYHGTFTKQTNTEIFLDEASVTATENILCLAAGTDEETTILGAACEPHIANLAQLLSNMGAQISGAGTNRIHIKGTKQLHGTNHHIRSDQIETATFAIMAAASHGDIIIHQALQEDFHMIGHYLHAMGVDYTFTDPQTLHITPSHLHAPQNVKELQSRPWPGFPTDALSPLIVLATQATGTTLVHEWMFEGRLLFADSLVAMGANIITADPHRIIVNGPTPLRGKALTSPDIRAGIALVIAGLIAEGTTTIDNAQLIFRGYQNLPERLTSLGAKVELIG